LVLSLLLAGLSLGPGLGLVFVLSLLLGALSPFLVAFVLSLFLNGPSLFLHAPWVSQSVEVSGGFLSRFFHNHIVEVDE
jgi:hypothetical protein